MVTRDQYCFYATFDVSSLCSYIPVGVAVLLPASSWARKCLRKPALPAYVTQRAADSGGFVASRLWGDYRYSLHEYVDWLATWRPQWAATMDYCCEPELEQVTRERQDRTTANAWQAWCDYRHVPWLWVPTLQGWYPSDYQRHALELLPLLREMKAFYGNHPLWRVGIGTLCRRATVETIQAVLEAVIEVLPDIPLHLWGVKLASLKSIDVRHVISSDSAAWHGLFRAGRKQVEREALASHMSKRAYTVRVQLPAYIAKVEQAIDESWARWGTDTDTTSLKEALQERGWTLHVRTRGCRQYAYAARRVKTTVEERYLGSLSDLLAMPAEQRIVQLGTLPAWSLPNNRSPTLPNQLPLLWQQEEPVACL
ncbi:MAG TPA: hypothetical protein VKV40_08090 [Ktedonobacteraceae bacterium]|nr:hypothetical protein [Ktedonobacteraceae bacterium]